MKEESIGQEPQDGGAGEGKAPDFSVCPYCGQPLSHGKIYGEGERAVYWLPIDRGINEIGWLLSAKRVERIGGMVLGDNPKIGFVQKAPPDSFYCKACKLLITKL